MQIFVILVTVAFLSSATTAAPDAKKLIVLTQQENPYYPPSTYPSAVFEISLQGDVRQVWNGTLHYGSNICAYAAPDTDKPLLYILKDEGTLLTVSTTTGRTLRTQNISSDDPPQWFSSLNYESATSSLYGICNASYGWPEGRQWCRIQLSNRVSKVPLTYMHNLPGWEYYSNEVEDCMFDGCFQADLFWYVLTEDHIIRGMNIHTASVTSIGFANPQSLNYDSSRNMMFDIKRLDNLFQPMVISQVFLVPPNATDPPNPPETTVMELPKSLSLVSTGMSVIDSDQHTVYALMTDQPNRWNRPVLPNTLVAVDVENKEATMKKLDFSQYPYVSGWRFSRLFIV